VRIEVAKPRPREQIVMPVSLPSDLHKPWLAQRSMPFGLQPTGRGFESRLLHGRRSSPLTSTFFTFGVIAEVDAAL
jgi:hypothetical protein